MRLAHRARTPATPAQVWSLLGDPGRWAGWDPRVHSVRGAGGRVAGGDRLLVVSRPVGLRVPVDVVEAEPERRLVLRVHLAPGLRELLTVELVPSWHGGTAVAVSVVVEGPLARAGVLPSWVGAGVVARLLAVRAARVAREAAPAA